MAATVLSDSELKAALTRLPHWTVEAGKLQRAFQFAGFVEAWAFMSMGALHAEKVDHHPDWSNVYNRVTIALTTHAAGGITERDVRFAEYFEKTAPLFA